LGAAERHVSDGFRKYFCAQAVWPEIYRVILPQQVLALSVDLLAGEEVGQADFSVVAACKLCQWMPLVQDEKRKFRHEAVFPDLIAEFAGDVDEQVKAPVFIFDVGTMRIDWKHLS